MKTTTLLSSVLFSALLSSSVHAQDITLKMSGGGIGQTLDFSVEGGVGQGYLLLMSTQYQPTALPAPHLSLIDVGLDLLTVSVSTPGFVGVTPASYSLPIPTVTSWREATLNFQALKVTGPVLSAKSNPWRMTLKQIGNTADILETSHFTRAFGTATRLEDGTVLLAGGCPVILPNSAAAAIFSDTAGSSGTEIYDHSTQSFELIGSMNQPRSRHTATRLADGRVLIVGGTNGTQALATAEIYDPATRSFQTVGPMAHGRVGHTATLLPDGRVWIAGGSTVGSSQNAIAANARNTSELFDPATDTFSAGTSIFFNRSFHTATLLDDGRVILAGGYSSSGGNNFVLASVMSYTPSSGSMLNMANLPEPRAGHGSLTTASGKIVIVGGMDGIHADAMAKDQSIVVDPFVNATGFSGSLGTNVAFPMVVEFEHGDVLVGGGVRGVGSFEQPLHVNTILDKTPSGGGLWQSTGDFDIPRYGSSYTLLEDGTVAVFNGLFFSNILLGSAENYKPTP